VAQNNAQTLTEIQQHEQQHPPQQKEAEETPEKGKPERRAERGVSSALMTTLLLIPLVLVVSIGVFIRWRKSRVYGGEAVTVVY